MEALNRQKALRCACGREQGEGGEGLEGKGPQHGDCGAGCAQRAAAWLF